MEIVLSLRKSKITIPSEYDADIPLLGIGICLEPEFDFQGKIFQYTLFVINDSWDDIMLDLSCIRLQEKILHLHGRLTAMTAIHACVIKKEIFDSKLEFIAQIIHKHFDKPILKSIKPNAATLFSNFEKIRLWEDHPMHFLSLAQIGELQNNPYFQKQKPEAIDLNQLVSKIHNNKVKEKKNNTRNEIIALSSFQRELDLHYDEKVNKSRPKFIIEEQLKRFHQYVDQAIRFRIESVKIIHGKGQGILKNKIDEEARINPRIKKIKLSEDGGSSFIFFEITN